MPSGYPYPLPSMPGHLDERKRDILRAVVREHVLHAEPVGSKALVETHGFQLSSATLRNEMSALEELGLLIQPHTSAGRIPTELGYRYYVDNMMDRPTLDEPEEEAVRDRIEIINSQVESVLQDVSGILSRMTRLMAISVSSGVVRRSIRKVDLVRLDRGRILILLVCADGEVLKAMRQLRGDEPDASLQRVEAFLEAHLAGADTSSLKRFRAAFHQWAYVELGHGPDGVLARGLIDQTEELLATPRESQLYFDGAGFILSQPEFAQSVKAEPVFSALQERGRFVELLTDVISAQRVVVRIGSELATLSGECGFVGASYTTSAGVTGAIGILGPVRMNYDRAVAAVSAVAHDLSAIL